MTALPPASLSAETRLQCYAGAGIDRATARRKDEAWITDQLSRAETKILPFWRGSHLIDGSDPTAPRGVLLRRGAEAGEAALAQGGREAVFLGLDGERAVFAIDLSGLDEATARGLFREGSLVPLREAGALLPAGEAGLYAYTTGILQWHQRHRFCGVCGHPAESGEGGHVRRCARPGCGNAIFPRLDPAVIALVEHRPPSGGPPVCLLGRGARLPPLVYSTLAGFVEPGESLEEAVIREVFEEAGCRVGEVVYRASQPWPFPASLMLGFRAQALTTEIALDGDELEDARWFTAPELRAIAAGDGAPDGPRLSSRRDSIARSLIDAWLAEID